MPFLTADAPPSTNGTEPSREVTGPQVVDFVDIGISGPELDPPSEDQGFTDYTKIRKMRRDPTIALARTLSMAPIRAATWSVVIGDSEDQNHVNAQTLIQKTVVTQRDELLRHSIYGMIDYGWTSFELIWGPYELPNEPIVNYSIARFKHLLNDYTKILVDRKTGAYRGLRQEPVNSQVVVDGFGGTPLEPMNTFTCYMNEEGTNWYGERLSLRYEQAFDDWNSVNKGAQKYDAKLAGALWVLYYPAGTTRINGVEKDNSVVAKELLQSVRASGGLTIPSQIDRVIGELNTGLTVQAWRLDLMESKGGATQFLDRMRYLDNLKVRSHELPERAVLEGQFGTKAEAGEHISFAINAAQMRHEDFLYLLNKHIVQRIVEFNYGPEVAEHVKIVASPIVDDQKDFVRKVYMTMLGDDLIRRIEYRQLDRESARRILELPEQEVGEMDVINQTIDDLLETTIDASKSIRPDVRISDPPGLGVDAQQGGEDGGEEKPKPTPKKKKDE